MTTLTAKSSESTPGFQRTPGFAAALELTMCRFEIKATDLCEAIETLRSPEERRPSRTQISKLLNGSEMLNTSIEAILDGLRFIDDRAAQYLCDRLLCKRNPLDVRQVSITADGVRSIEPRMEVI